MATVKSRPSGIAVLCCDDYNAFNMIKGNRVLDMNKIRRIHYDCETGTNLLPYFPILVTRGDDGKYNIIDGQHRYMVAKKLKHPVYYILAEKLSLYQIARLNSNTEKWKYNDYINCYSQIGNKSYKAIAALLKEFPKLPVTTAVNLLAEGKIGTGGGKIMDMFKKGEFVANHVVSAKEMCEKIDSFDFDQKFTRYFMIAISKVITAGVYSVDELIKKVNADPSALKEQTHFRQYLSNLTEIASKGKHKSVVIY